MSKAVEVIRDGKIVPELQDIFQLIKDFDVVLGTGHLSPEEIFRVVEAARNAGVRKIVVTHPEWWMVGMSLEDQVDLYRIMTLFWNIVSHSLWEEENIRVIFL